MASASDRREANISFLKEAIRKTYEESGNVEKRGLVAFVCLKRGLAERKVKEYLSLLELSGLIETIVNEHGQWIKWLGGQEALDFGSH